MANKRETKSIEAIAFRHGTQDISQEDTIREVEARFENLREEESRRATDPIKALEATTDTLTKRNTDASERWERMKSSTGGRDPCRAFHPLPASACIQLRFARVYSRCLQKLIGSVARLLSSSAKLLKTRFDLAYCVLLAYISWVLAKGDCFD